jgi:hypothetical protein
MKTAQFDRLAATVQVGRATFYPVLAGEAPVNSRQGPSGPEANADLAAKGGEGRRTAAR